MTRDDIIKMAREAWDRDTDPWLTYEQAFLERFAALVAAAEREACAQIADKVGEDDDDFHAWAAANFIRARGQE